MSQAVSLRKLIGVSLDASPLGATVIVPPFEVVWFGYCYWSVRSTASCESSLMLIRSCLRPRSNIVRGVRATDARRENHLGAHKTSGGGSGRPGFCRYPQVCGVCNPCHTSLIKRTGWSFLAYQLVANPFRWLLSKTRCGGGSGRWKALHCCPGTDSRLTILWAFDKITW
jgi:hypothetical protein